MRDGRDAWLVPALLQGLVFALLVAVVSAAFGPWLATRVAEATRVPTCDDPRGLVRVVPTSVRATSHLAPEGSLRYDPELLVDGDSGTAWVEGEPGLGIGEQVTLTFARTFDVALLCVVNGYANTWSLYQRNARVRGLDVVGSDGSLSVTLRDAGTPEHPAVFQDVPLSLRTSELRLTLTSAYAGSGRDRYPDTSLSELEVWAAD